MTLEFDLHLPRDRFDIQVSESLPLDGIWGIMGPSGCGKTSLLRGLAGLEKQAHGRVSCNGQLWQDSNQGLFIPPEKRRIGYIFQEARLFPHLDVRGNLQFSAKRAAADQHAPDWDDVINQTGIEHLLTRSISKLSGGEKQRVAIARTLLNAPSLLLMDEPLASLDWRSKLALMPCLREVHRHFGIPVVMVSHGHEELARLADHLLLLQEGRVLEKGSCRALINRSTDAVDGEATPLSVLEARIARHDPGYPLTELSLNDSTLVVHRLDKAPGQSVRMVLPAHEVSIVLEDIHCTSVQNRLPVVVDSMAESGARHILLTLSLSGDSEGQSLLALVTRKSVDQLELAVGQPVYAHFKASGLEVL
ncbi:MAG: molybdenum ABC transporter ATP-binding protein [Endozoicomonas sp.]